MPPEFQTVWIHLFAMVNSGFRKCGLHLFAVHNPMCIGLVLASQKRQQAKFYCSSNDISNLAWVVKRWRTFTIKYIKHWSKWVLEKMSCLTFYCIPDCYLLSFCIKRCDMCTLLKICINWCHIFTLLSRIPWITLNLAKSQFACTFPWTETNTDIIWLFAYCKGDNFNIHIWAWFGYFIC